ncbi:MAG: hypothetical protein CL845_07185 [Crocinitomicaceae bacterium]|nr:hypothetical protein [Crocinitomicaceae bacterium]
MFEMRGAGNFWKMENSLVLFCAMLCSSFLFGQTLQGKVIAEDGFPIPYPSIVWKTQSTESNVLGADDGTFQIGIEEFPGTLSCSAVGYEATKKSIDNPTNSPLVIVLNKLTVEINQALIESTQSSTEWLPSLSNGGLYRGMKSLAIRPEATLSVPGEVQARNIFSAIAGANIWESDAAGLQLGIGVRGLSPNRSAYLSIRQDGVPIAADPLGYPEAYYTPPLQMVEAISLVSGAAALQYGSQLGGLLNFQMKRWNGHDAVDLTCLISATAYLPEEREYRGNQHVAIQASLPTSAESGLFFAIDNKTGTGWRENGRFKSTTFHINGIQNISEDLTIREHISYMTREEQQPGGLTKALFDSSPRFSTRNRNWFSIDWFVGGIGIDFQTSSRWKLNADLSTVVANRKSLGFLGTPDRIDFGQERGLITADFRSITWDLRGTRTWKNNVSGGFNALLIGSQGLRGDNQMRQGWANDSDNADFTFVELLAGPSSDTNFPNYQESFFAQGIIGTSPRLSLTPGIRCERIRTSMRGEYREVATDLNGNFLEDSIFNTRDSRSRVVILPGIGFSWKEGLTEVYGNAVRNFRAINFSDIQLTGLGVVVDPNISDEFGANFDVGFRRRTESFQFDFSVYCLLYKERIGLMPAIVEAPPPIFQKAIFLRNNLNDARTLGIELSISKQIELDDAMINCGGSIGIARGQYVDGDSPIQGNELEFVPDYTCRGNVMFTKDRWNIQLHGALTGKQFTDATNAEYTPTAVYGEIPAYAILDFGLDRQIGEGDFSLGLKLNNLTDSRYFTRRALAYPGPGILPADGFNTRVALTYAPAR